MESVTKNRQSRTVLRAMIERAYGAPAVPALDDWSELGFGWFNAAYRVRLRDGREVVIKIAPPRDVTVMEYEVGAMQTEWAMIRLLQAETDLPIPRIDFADDTRELCDAAWFAMPFSRGANLSDVLAAAGPAERMGWWEAVGAANRQINDVVGSTFGALDGSGASTWRSEFLGRLEAVLRDGERANVDLGVSYADVRACIEQRASSLDDVTEPRLVAWDLWPGNVLVGSAAAPGRPGIVAIIDHERALYGDPLMEAGFGGEILADFSDAAAFRSGWGRGELQGSERTRRWLYSLHLLLIMVIETAYRAHGDVSAYGWARERLGELLAGAGEYE